MSKFGNLGKIWSNFGVKKVPFCQREFEGHKLYVQNVENITLNCGHWTRFPREYVLFESYCNDTVCILWILTKFG